ncbi:MAG: hypothetical protein LN413_02710 [Candidatus Thermoplasmatota archaeon]|nr:hypothetical protein [Candidatus Thermoplasmatota archaeon]
MSVVTFREMQETLVALLGRQVMGPDEVGELAEYLLGFFGYGTEVVDNVLQPDDRDVFYMLEEEGLLSTRQEEVLVTPGRLWRLHYWILRVDHVKRALQKAGDEAEEHEVLYENMADEVWVRRQAS